MERGTKAIATLKFFAWFDLLASIIGAIVILAKYSSRSISSSYYPTAEKVIDPIAIGIGIGVLLQGVFVCALFLVIASIADNFNFVASIQSSMLDELISIRKNTVPK